MAGADFSGRPQEQGRSVAYLRIALAAGVAGAAIENTGIEAARIATAAKPT